MYNEMIDTLKASLEYWSEQKDWNEWEYCREQLDALFEAGYYGTEEAQYIIGEA